MGNTDQGGYNSRAQSIPSQFLKWVNRYKYSSEELQEMNQVADSVLYTELLDLSVARPRSNPYVISRPGRAVVIYGVTTSTAYNPLTNAGVETVVNTVVAGCFFNDNLDPNSMWVLKHGRGFRGDFRKLQLTWPAQSSNSARLVVFNFDDVPFFSGDVPT